MSIALLGFSGVALEVCTAIFIIALVGGVVAWRIVRRVKRKKSGEGCPSCCEACSSRGSCAQAKKRDTASDDMPEIAVQSDIGCDFSDLSGDKPRK